MTALVEHSGIFAPNIIIKNEKGEITFSMKRKDEWGPPYYIFELHRELMSEEVSAKFSKTWDSIKAIAAAMNIPLYDHSEIMDALEGISSTIDLSEAEKAALEAERMSKPTFVKDIKIKVFDHAKGKINTLTIGISIASKKYVEEAGR